MTSPVLAELVTAVQKTLGVEASAVTFINGFTTRLNDAVAKALANGASEAELQPVRDEIAAMQTSADALAAAMAANP